MEPYRRVLDELSVVKGVICKGRRIFIPASLQKKVVKLCYESHLGMSKTKLLARSFCWFPEMDIPIERKISKCLTCQSIQDDKNMKQPVKPHELPKGPWLNVEMDFQGPYLNGDTVPSQIVAPPRISAPLE